MCIELIVENDVVYLLHVYLYTYCTSIVVMQHRMDRNGLASEKRTTAMCVAAHRSAYHWYIVLFLFYICKLSTVTNGVRTLYTPTKRQSIVKLPARGLFSVLFSSVDLILFSIRIGRARFRWNHSNSICLPIVIAHKLKTKINFHSPCNSFSCSFFFCCFVFWMWL